MEKKNYKNNNSVNKQTLNLLEKEEDINQLNSHNCYNYENKSDCINEDIFFKRKDDNDLTILDKNKTPIDSNLIEKNLHEFLNDDLIKALDNGLMDPEENNELSDSSSSNAYNSGSTENNSNSNSPEQNIKLPKNKEDISMNLNCEKNSIITNLNNIQNNLSLNIGNIDNINFNINVKNEQIKNEDNLNDNINIKEKIEILNKPLFAQIVIPKTINNSKKKKHSEENEYNYDKKKEKKNNCLKNKFDDDVEPIIMLSMGNEEKTKLPLEIRVGDWICFYCNNLNFSFRIKCNRCGLLRKSTMHLLKKQYYSNKFQYMTNYNNYNDNCYMDFNQNYNCNNNYSSKM